MYSTSDVSEYMEYMESTIISTPAEYGSVEAALNGANASQGEAEGYWRRAPASTRE